MDKVTHLMTKIKIKIKNMFGHDMSLDCFLVTKLKEI